MNKKNILLLIIFIATTITVQAQNTVIKLQTDSAISVNLFYPINCHYNSYISEEINLIPGKTIETRLNINGFCYLRIESNENSLFWVLLMENDALTIEYKNKNFVFSGTNAVANDLNTKIWLGAYSYMVDDIFSRYYKDNTIDIPLLHKCLEEEIFSSYYKKIDTIGVSDKIQQIMKRNLNYFVNDRIIKNYKTILSGANGKVSTSDSLKIDKQVMHIFKQLPANDKNTLKYSHANGYFDKYYRDLSLHLSEEKQNAFYKENEAKIFGPYISYLLASDIEQSTRLAEVLIIQLKYKVNEMDNEKVFEYLKKLNPQNEYIDIIEKLFEEERELKAGITPQFIGGKIHSLKELSQTKELSGQYLFIDLWATWCMPCRSEFLHHKELNKVLNQYKNLNSVYISIDDDKDDDKWRRDVEQLNLSGYNLRASAQLIDELKQAIYNGGDFSVPRYILLNPKGEIIDSDLPRPSDIDSLQQVLDKKIHLSITFGEREASIIY